MRSWLPLVVLVGCANPYPDDTSDPLETDTTVVVETDETDTTDTDVPVITDRCLAFATYGAVAHDETLASPPSFRNDRPAVGVSADGTVNIAYSVAENGYHGFWAERTSTGWDESATPFEIATSGIAYDDDGSPLVIAYGGAGNTGIWRHSGTAWTLETTPQVGVVQYAGGSSSTYARASDGSLHALLTPSGDYSQIGYARYDGSLWSYERIGDVANFVSAAGLALAQNDAPHVVFWDSDDTVGWKLMYRNPAGSVSTGYVPGTTMLESPWVDMAADAGAPMAIVDPQRHGAHYEVAALVGKQTPFTEIVVATGTEAQFCGEPVGTCDVDYEAVYPVGVATDAQGGAWWAWARVHVVGTYVAVCGGMPYHCEWQGGATTNDGTLSVSCMDEQSVLHEKQILDVYGPGSGDMTVAGDTLHLATYDWDYDAGTSVVRYTQVALIGN